MLKRIKSALYFSLGADRLDEKFIRFAMMHVMYLLATSITMTFVNTLLMRVATDDTASVIVQKYNIVHFIFVGSSMVLAAFLMDKLNNKKVILLGVALSMLTYLLVLVFMDIILDVYVIVAIVHGIATGVYWITYFNSLLIYTTDETRDVAMGFLGVFSGLVSLIMPLVSGYVIAAFTDSLMGYYIMFGLCFLAAGVAVYLVLRLPIIEPERKKTKFKLLMKNIYTQKVWYLVIHMDFFKGIREGAFGFFLNVLLFAIVEDEGLIGLNGFLVAVASMISCIVAGKIVKPQNRLKHMLLSTTILAVTNAVLFYELNTWTVLLLSVVNSYLGVFIVNPTTTTLYTVFDKIKGASQLKNEALAVTECYKNFGRIVGVLLIMFLPKTDFYSVLSLFILIVMQYVTALFAKLTMNEVAKKQKEYENA